MRSITLGLTCFAFVACGPGSGSIATVDDFVDQYAQAICTDLANCGAIGKSEIPRCVDNVKAQYAASKSAYDYNAAISAGRIRFDSSAANTCVDGIRHASCLNLFAAFSSSCSKIFTGTVSTGNSCQNTVECAGGFCQSTNMTGTSCPGTCVAWAAEGASCASPARCQNGVDFCDQQSMTCKPLGAVGAACQNTTQCQAGVYCVSGACAGPAQLGQPCGFTGAQCGDGLYCDYAAQSPTCKTPIPAGSACAGTERCVDGNACVSGTCHPYLDAGGACTAMMNGAQTGCPSDMSCQNGVCTSTAAMVGSSCANNAGCKPDLFPTLYCRTSDMTCQTKIDLGQPCTPQSGDNPCFSGTCDSMSNTCVLQCM